MTSVEKRALLVDLDGTLADSLPVMREVYGRFLAERGAVATDAEFARLNGPPLKEVVRLLREIHGFAEDCPALLARFQELADEVYREVVPMAGARALLERAKAAGYAVGIVTSNSARRTRAWLERVGLHGLVDLLVAEEDVTRGKPHPEPYLLAVERAGCDAAVSIAVEDAPQGASAARDAGLRTFVIDRGAGCAWPEGVERIAGLEQLAERL